MTSCRMNTNVRKQCYFQQNIAYNKTGDCFWNFQAGTNKTINDTGPAQMTRRNIVHDVHEMFVAQFNLINCTIFHTLSTSCTNCWGKLALGINKVTRGSIGLFGCTRVFIRRFAKPFVLCKMYQIQWIQKFRSRKFGNCRVEKFRYVKFKLHRLVTRESRKYKTHFCCYSAVKETQPRFT